MIVSGTKGEDQVSRPPEVDAGTSTEPDLNAERDRQNAYLVALASLIKPLPKTIYDAALPQVRLALALLLPKLELTCFTADADAIARA